MTTQIVKEETCCRHMGYSFQLTARDLLYAPSHRQDSTYHGLCYTSRGSLAGTWNSSMGPPHEGSIPRPIAPWANVLTTELHLTCEFNNTQQSINAVSNCEMQQRFRSYISLPGRTGTVLTHLASTSLRRGRRSSLASIFAPTAPCRVMWYSCWGMMSLSLAHTRRARFLALLVWQIRLSSSTGLPFSRKVTWTQRTKCFI